MSLRTNFNQSKQYIRFVKGFIKNYSSKPNDRQAELMAKGLPKKKAIPNVKNIIIIASGKGGVGKSTSAVNVAVTLSAMGKRVGLLDSDIFGPSVPLMMNLKEAPLIDDNNMMIPPINYGVKCLSMGLLVNQGPVVWRGPLVMSALQRLLNGAVWGPLDILIIDTPPGTGDVHLSLAQNVPVSGVLLVSTPQRAALEVTQRGAEMYKAFKTPVIGLIENMSHTECHNCHKKIELFNNITENFCKEMNTEIIGSIPIDKNISHASDTGIPLCIKDPESPFAKSYKNIGLKVLTFLEK